MANSSDYLREDGEKLGTSAKYFSKWCQCYTHQCSRYPIEIFAQLRMHVIKAFFSLSHAVFLKFPR